MNFSLDKIYFRDVEPLYFPIENLGNILVQFTKNTSDSVIIASTEIAAEMGLSVDWRNTYDKNEYYYIGDLLDKKLFSSPFLRPFELFITDLMDLKIKINVQGLFKNSEFWFR